MNRQISYKIVSLVLCILVVCFVVGFYVFAWTEPTETPPAGNAPTPLNTSNVGQSKAGGLILNTGGAVNGLIVDKGNVGIGTTVPTAKLEVNGGMRINGGARILGNLGIGTSPQAELHIVPIAGNTDLLLETPQGKWAIAVREADGMFEIHDILTAPSPGPTPFRIHKGAPESSLEIFSNGKVWIRYGTTADYVFEPDYNLMPIEELAEYVKVNGRLPGMTEEEGNDGTLNDLIRKHTEKIEELTLYIIEQNEKIEDLNRRLSDLEDNK